MAFCYWEFGFHPVTTKPHSTEAGGLRPVTAMEIEDDQPRRFAISAGVRSSTS
jgi:hypothetical protein